MTSYLRSTPPDQLTPNELASIRPNPVVVHYRGSIREYQTGEFHVCELCRPTRLKEFFAEFNGNFVGREQELQEMAFRLGVTQLEYDLNQQKRDMGVTF